MNWNQVQGNWKQFTGKVKEKWGELTVDEIDQIAGKRYITPWQDPREMRDRTRGSRKASQGLGEDPRLIVGIF
jgi:hypothetical protein